MNLFKNRIQTEKKKKVKTLLIILFASMTIMTACSSPKQKPIIYTRGLSVGDALGILLMDERIEEQQKQEVDNNDTKLIDDNKGSSYKEIVSPKNEYEELKKDNDTLYLGMLLLLIYLLFKDEEKK